MTDESLVYPDIGEAFAGHGTVNHSTEEYVRAYFWHTNTVENYFSLFKVPSTAAISTSAKPICTGTLPSATSFTTIARNSVSTIRHVPMLP